MKTLFALTLFLFLSLSTFGFEREVRAPEQRGGATSAPVVSIPKFQVNTLQSMSKMESTSKEVEQISKSNIKKLAFDPLLRVIGNKGGFTTSFKMDLPPLFLSLKEIQFSYFTQYRDFSFLGNGWRWNIPKISNRESANFLPHTVEGILGEGDLKEVEFSEDDIRGHVESILRGAGQKSDNLDFNIFQINYSSNENYFIRLNNHNLGWIVLSPNGERWIFNTNGDPVKVFDKYGHSISIKWSGKHLLKMTYSNNAQVEFKYTNGNLTLIKIINASENRSFEIRYSENRLKYASYVDAVLPTFQGEYRDLYQEIEVSDKVLGVNDYKSSNGVKASEGFNNFIKFDFGKYESAINSIINGQRYYNNWHGEYYEHFVVDEYRTPHISNRLDSVPMTISNQVIPSEFKPYSVNVRTSDTWDKKKKLHIIQNHFNVINKRALFLVDMNNDGDKDLVSCPVNDISGNFASNLLKALKGASFRSELGKSLVGYSSWRDQGFKLLSKAEGEFHCNENTFFLDWDRDGRIDVLNLSKLYLNTKKGFEKINLDLNELRKRFISFVDGPSKKEDLVIRDLDRDGVFEIYNSEKMKGKTVKLNQNIGLLTTIHSPFGGRVDVKYQIYQKNTLLPVEFKYVGDKKVETEKIFYLSPKEDSAFEEIVHMRKSAKSTISVERKIYCNVTSYGDVESRKTRNTLCLSTKYDSIASYNYFKDRVSDHEDERDEFYNYLNSSVNNLDIINVNDRPNINTPLINPGRWPELSTIVRGLSFGGRKRKGKADLEMSNYDPSKIELKSENYLWTIDNRPIPHGVIFNKKYKSIDGRNSLVSSYESKFYQEFISGKKNIFSKSSTSFSYRKGVSFKTTKSKKGYRKDLVFNVNYDQLEKGIDEVVTNSLDMSGNSQRISRKKYEYNTDLLRPVGIRTFLDNDKAPINFENITYDEEGRVVKKGEFNNTLTEYSYKDQSPFLIFKIENGKTTHYSYAQTTGFLQRSQIDGVTKNYSYSSDGFLLEINLNDISIYTFTPPEIISTNFPIKLSREFNEMKNDMSFSYELGPMGRVKKSQKEGSEVVEKFEYSLFGGLLSHDNGSVLTKYDISSHCSIERKVSSHSGDLLSRVQKCQKGLDQSSDVDGVLGHVKFEGKDILESRVGSMFINPSFNKKGELIHFEQLPFLWEKNIEGESLEQIFKISESSNILRRKYHYREKKLVDEYGSSFKFNKYGQVLETNSNREESHILNESYLYDYGNLSTATLGEVPFTYGHKNGLVNSVKFLNDRIEFEYDDYFRLIKKQWGTHFEGRVFENGLVSRIDPFVVDVERGSLEEVKRITFSNGASLSYKIDELGRDTGVELENNGHTIYESNNSYTSFSKISQVEQEFFSRRTNHEYQYGKVIVKEKKFNNLYTSGLDQVVIEKDVVQDYRLTINHPEKLIRNKNLQAEAIGELKIKYINDMPIKVFHGDKVIHQFFTASGEMKGSCLGLEKLDPMSSFCWMKIDQDHFKIMGDNFSLVRLEGRPIGVAVNDKFYPGFFDHRGSLLGLLDSESGELLFVREFSDYGVKSVEFNSNLGRIDLEKAKELESEVVWSFAHLFENPFLSGKGIYFSNSRTLSSHHGEWLTFDPMLKWSPENLINNPTDMNGLKYVNGDPVNFVDPSGYVTIFAGTGGGAGAGTGGRLSGGVWINKNPNQTWSPFSGGYYTTIEVGGHYGMSAGAGGEIGFVTGHVSDFEGISTVHGGSGGFLGKFGADYSFTKSGAHGGAFSFESGVGGAAYQRVSHTWAFDADPDSLMGKAIDFANNFYNEHWGTEPSYFDYNSDNFSFGDWSFDASL